MKFEATLDNNNTKLGLPQEVETLDEIEFLEYDSQNYYSAAGSHHRQCESGGTHQPVSRRSGAGCGGVGRRSDS